MIALIRAKSKYELAPCPCGRPARHPGSCWANRSGVVGKRHLTRLEQGLRAGKTSHQMADELKLSVMTVLKHSVPIRERLFGEGLSCACGRPLNHNYWCSARWDAHEMPRGRQPFAGEDVAVEALLRGDLVADIAKAARVGTSAIWRLRQDLSDEQLRQRRRVMRDRHALSGDDGAGLMAKIKGMVPRTLVATVYSADGRASLDTSLRDEVVAELYLAVVEGRVEAEQLKAVVRSFISRGMSQWQSRFGSRSLDEKTGGDDGRALIDTLADDTALGDIDELSIGGEE